MRVRVWGVCVVALTQLVLFTKATAQEVDSLPVQTAFAGSHIGLDWDGLTPPWLGRAYENQRIHWTLDSLNILQDDLQDEWVPSFTGRSGGVFLYHIQAGDTTGVPIAYDLDTYRLIKAEHNTLADWQRSVQAQLELRDAEKARDLVAISLPFKLPKAVTSIVGEGGAGLKVNGFKRIEFSGRSTWNDRPNVTSAQAQSRFPTLDMEQTTQMTITGKIGSKIEVKVDQDSRRTTDLGNSIQLRYRGYEDEIIQSIEAGNTNLSLPNTQFVGYSQSVQGLFGVKAEAKVGHINFTAIASQEKGSTEGASFTAGAQGSQSYIRDNQYLPLRYFWLYNPYSDSNFASRIIRGDSIITFKLFRTSDAEKQDLEPSALVMPSIPPGATIDSARSSPATVFDQNQDKRNVSLIEETDYYVARKEFWVTLSDDSPIRTDQILGFYAEIQTPFGVDTVGEIADTASATVVSLILKMLKPAKELVPKHPCWNLEWKNVYDLGVRNVTEEGLKVDVYRGTRNTETQEGQNLNNVNGTRIMEILGLDRLATNGALVPDGQLDNNPALIDRARGHLIFPNRFPFAPTTYPDTVNTDPVNVLGDRATYAQDSTRLESEATKIYTESTGPLRERESKYYLVVTTTERRTSYSLGRVNILEGSERVRLNGRDLVRGVDYQISYEIGQINFISEEVLDPNANVTVDYEYEPFFSVDRKSLLGVRGDYRPSENFHWGATALYKNESQPDNQKPRLGEEPSRTWVYDTDMGMRTGVNFLTKLTDALPLVEANAPSTIDIAGEFAQSLPNPNTLGEVFIDDFEASQEVVSLPLLRESWYPSSAPAGYTVADRGHGIWYNRFDPYRITEIYNKEEVPAEDRTQVLTLKFENSLGPQKWGGVTRPLSAGLQNLSNTQFIEFRVQGNRGKLVLNMGKISEDIDGGGILNTEDTDVGFFNGVLDSLEDTGLDGLFDVQEPGFDPDTLPDPSGDDWHYNSDTAKGDYSHINGTEGNRPDPLRGWLPDTEDINGNNSLELSNQYFEFELDLADPNDPFLVKNSDYCNECSDGTTLGPWRTFRIPISDSTLNLVSRIVGNPDLSEVEYMRLYITDVDSGQTSQVNIADMNLVSYRWRDIKVESQRDSSQALLVSVVNTRENKDYVSPPGVEEVVDKVTLIGQGEQSLLIGFSGLLPRVPGGDSSVVIDTLADSTVDTTLTVRDVVDRARVSQKLLSAQDFTGYRTLEMYVHGDDTADGQYEFFVQFGTDSLNFYEYHVPVYPGWSSSNFVHVNFDDLTGFKFNVQEGLTNQDLRDVDTTEGNLRLRGNPSLSRMEYLAMGVTNRDAGRARSGTLWVDELRLTDVRRDEGWAGRLSVNTNLSDFGGVSVNYRAQNYAFKTLTSGRQNVVNSSSQDDISLTARVSPEKILPPSIPLQIPVSYNWGRTKSTPYLITRSDIVVPEDQRDEQASTTERSGLSMGLRYSRQQGNLFERVFLIPVSASFSTSKSNSTSPTMRYATSSGNTAQARYQVALQKPPALPYLYWTRLLFMPKSIYQSRLELLPSRFAAQGSYQERRSVTQYVSGGNLVESFARDFAGDFNLGYAPIRDFTFDYTYRTTRDLRDPNTINLAFSNPKLGVETQFGQTYRTAYTNRWIWFLEQRYSYDVGYTETRERQTDNTLTTTSTRDFQAGWGVTWLRLVGRPNPKDRFFTWKLHQPVRKLVRGVLGRLDNLAVSMGVSRQLRDFGLEDRPWWSYVWGFSDTTMTTQLGSQGITSRNSDSKATSWSARTGVALLGSRITGSYTLRQATSDNSSNRTGTWSETFPSVRVTYTDLSKMALIKRLMNSATLEFGYDVKRDSQYNVTTGLATSASKDVRFTPLMGISMNWRGNISTQVKMDHSQRTTEQPSSATRSTTRGTDDDITFGLRYSFSAPGGIRLPLLSGIRLKSTMNLTLAASYGKATAEAAVNGGIYQLTSERTTMTVQPQVGYSFSQTLTGGLRARWQDTDDRVQQAKTHVRELGFWVEFRF